MVVFSFGERERAFTHHAQRSTTVDNIHPVLRLDDRFGLGCVRFLNRRVAFEDFCTVHRPCSALHGCDLEGRKINFSNSKTLVGWLVGVATDRNARYI